LMKRHRVAEKFPIPRAVDRTFLTVDLEFQLALQKLCDRFQYPFTSSPRLHVDHAVVCIPTKGVSSSLQFLVQVIQEDVGQQGGERPTLRCSLSSYRYEAVLHHSSLQVAAYQSQDSFVT